MADPQPKFAVGQQVRLVVTSSFNAPGAYEITRVLPAAGGDLQYRVKSKSENYERMVNERDLIRTV